MDRHKTVADRQRQLLNSVHLALALVGLLSVIGAVLTRSPFEGTAISTISNATIASAPINNLAIASAVITLAEHSVYLIHDKLWTLLKHPIDRDVAVNWFRVLGRLICEPLDYSMVVLLIRKMDIAALITSCVLVLVNSIVLEIGNNLRSPVGPTKPNTTSIFFKAILLCHAFSFCIVLSWLYDFTVFNRNSIVIASIFAIGALFQYIIDSVSMVLYVTSFGYGRWLLDVIQSTIDTCTRALCILLVSGLSNALYSRGIETASTKSP